MSMDEAPNPIQSNASLTAASGQSPDEEPANASVSLRANIDTKDKEKDKEKKRRSLQLRSVPILREVEKIPIIRNEAKIDQIDKKEKEERKEKERREKEQYKREKEERKEAERAEDKREKEEKKERERKEREREKKEREEKKEKEKEEKKKIALKDIKEKDETKERKRMMERGTKEERERRKAFKTTQKALKTANAMETLKKIIDSDFENEKVAYAQRLNFLQDVNFRLAKVSQHSVAEIESRRQMAQAFFQFAESKVATAPLNLCLFKVAEVFELTCAEREKLNMKVVDNLSEDIADSAEKTLHDAKHYRKEFLSLMDKYNDEVVRVGHYTNKETVSVQSMAKISEAEEAKNLIQERMKQLGHVTVIQLQNAELELTNSMINRMCDMIDSQEEYYRNCYKAMKRLRPFVLQCREHVVQAQEEITEQMAEHERKTREMGHKKEFKKLIKKQHIEDEGKKKKIGKMTRLHVAAQQGRVDMIKTILLDSVSFVDVNSRDERGMTALHISAMNGQEDICDLLISKGANINEQDNDGNTPLHLSALCGHSNIVNYLLKNNCRRNLLNAKGETALHSGARGGNTECILLLIEAGVDVSIHGEEGTAIEVAKSAEVANMIRSCKEVLTWLEKDDQSPSTNNDTNSLISSKQNSGSALHPITPPRSTANIDPLNKNDQSMTTKEQEVSPPNKISEKMKNKQNIVEDMYANNSGEDVNITNEIHSESKSAPASPRNRKSLKSSSYSVSIPTSPISTNNMGVNKAKSLNEGGNVNNNTNLVASTNKPVKSKPLWITDSESEESEENPFIPESKIDKEDSSDEKSEDSFSEDSTNEIPIQIRERTRRNKLPISRVSVNLRHPAYVASRNRRRSLSFDSITSLNPATEAKVGFSSETQSSTLTVTPEPSITLQNFEHALSELRKDYPEGTFSFEVQKRRKKTRTYGHRLLIIHQNTIILKRGKRETVRYAAEMIQCLKSLNNNRKLTFLWDANKDEEIYIFTSPFERERCYSSVFTAKHGLNLPPEWPNRKQKIDIFMGTWNMGDAPPGSGIERWIPHKFDIYAIGVQECSYDPGIGVEAGHLRTNSCEYDWFARVQKHLGKEYIKFSGLSLASIRMMLLVRRKHYHSISHVKTGLVMTGVGGLAGNKGAVGIRFFFNDTSFCFINSHLAAHQGKVEQRNADYRDIVRGLSQEIGISNSFDITNTFDHLFWFGDLNYRIDISRNEAMEWINEKKWNLLAEKDQLNREIENDNAFLGFNEEIIVFKPTYKYVPGHKDLYTEYKKRVPAWCDRILRKSLPNRDEDVNHVVYGCCDDVTSSDHHPVFSVYSIDTHFPPLLLENQNNKDAVIRITNLKIKGLRFSNNEGATDPFVSFHSPILTSTSCTISIPKTRDPQWNDNEIPPLYPIYSSRKLLEKQYIQLLVEDKNNKSTNSRKAQAVVSLGSSLKNQVSGNVLHFKEKLTSNGYGHCGEIEGTIAIEVTNNHTANSNPGNTSSMSNTSSVSNNSSIYGNSSAIAGLIGGDSSNVLRKSVSSQTTPNLGPMSRTPPKHGMALRGAADGGVLAASGSLPSNPLPAIPAHIQHSSPTLSPFSPVAHSNSHPLPIQHSAPSGSPTQSSFHPSHSHSPSVSQSPSTTPSSPLSAGSQPTIVESKKSPDQSTVSYSESS